MRLPPMPFSGAGDPKLPAHVKRLSAKRRRQWVAVWNSTFARTSDEGQAFRAANAAVKEADVPDDERPPVQTTPALVNGPATSPATDAETAVTGAALSETIQRAIQDATIPDEAKHLRDADTPLGGVVPVYSIIGAFGGAETFDDYDEWKAAAKRQDEIDSLASIFDSLVQNIRNDPALALEVKASKIAAVAGELGVRVQRDTDNQHDEDAKALDDPATESFWFEGEDFSFTYSRDQAAAAEKAATKREGTVQLRASDFADVPDAAKPSTWKLPLVRGRSGGFDLARIGDAITALQPGGFRGQRVQLGSPKARVVSRISAAITKAAGDTKRKSDLRERLAKVKEHTDGGSFTVFKDATGAWRWLAMHSNEYRDRDGERFAKEAHDEYVRWVDAEPKSRMPELRIWHVKGSRLGRADLVDHTTEGFMIASGTFDPDMDRAAKALADSDEDLGCSHGFWFDADAFRDGVYHRYRSFEVSVLPRDRAANEATGFIAGKEVPMLNPDKKSALVRYGGQDWADTVETRLGDIAKDAEEKGISYKELEASVLSITEVTKSDAPGDSDPPKVEATVATESALEPLAKALAGVAESVKTIAETVERQGEQLAALKEADATKIAEAFRPRFDPSKGHVASESEKSETDDDDPAVKAAKEQAAGGVPDYLAGYMDPDGGLRGLGAQPVPAEGAPA